MAALPPPPTPAEMAANRGPNIIAGNVTVAVLATIGVITRFLARWAQGRVYGADDWLILLALPFGWGMAATTIVAVDNGLGRHLNTLLPARAAALVPFGEAYYASEILWTVSIPIIKISILLLYIRIFGKLRYFRVTAFALGGFIVAWAVTTLMVIIFQCQPVRKAWLPATPGHCIDSTLYFVIGSALNCATDVAILVLPMHAVWNLQLSRFQRVSLLATFAIGSLSCIFGLVRLAEVITQRKNPDITWALSWVALWSTAESCLGITAACLPTLRPLFSRALRNMTGKSSGYHSSSYASSGKLRSDKGEPGSNLNPDKSSYSAQVSFGGSRATSSNSENDEPQRPKRIWMPLRAYHKPQDKGVVVKREVEIRRENE